MEMKALQVEIVLVAATGWDGDVLGLLAVFTQMSSSSFMSMATIPLVARLARWHEGARRGKLHHAKEEIARGTSIRARLVRVKLRASGGFFPSPKRLGADIRSCWRGIFLSFYKNKD
jgi:hypothetical protein